MGAMKRWYGDASAIDTLLTGLIALCFFMAGYHLGKTKKDK